MKEFLVFGLALALAAMMGASASALPTFKIDVNEGTSPTAADWSGLSAAHTGNGGSLTVDGVRFDVFSADGARDRGGANALTGDFIYDNGENQSVGLRIWGLPDSLWEAKVWSWDDALTDLGFQTIFLGDTSNPGAPRVILETEFDPDPTEPFTFTFDSSEFLDGFGIYALENNALFRARFNALQLTPVTDSSGAVPEPAALALLGIGSIGLAVFRRRQ
jgi:hypothetical protein